MSAPVFEADPVAGQRRRAGQDRHDDHGENGRNRVADAGGGTGERGELLPVMAGLRDRGDHGPERDVHQGIGHAPQDVEDCHPHAHRAVRHAARNRKESVDREGVEDGAGQDPRAEPSPAGPRLRDDNAHERIIQGIENPGAHEHRPDEHGAHAQHHVVVVQQVAVDQHVDDILAERSEAERQLVPYGEFHGTFSFLLRCCCLRHRCLLTCRLF